MASTGNMGPSYEQNNKKCDICQRHFSRAEHLSRHRRIHTKEKPFTCPYCHKSFQRSDVQAGHVKRCRAAPLNRYNGPLGVADPARKRARIACGSCRRKKVRCDGNEPCAKCLYAQSACNYRAATGSPPAQSTASLAEPAADPFLDQTTGDSPVSNIVHPTSVDFAAHHTEHNETSLDRSPGLERPLDTDLDAAQDCDRGLLDPGNLGPGDMPADLNWMCDLPGMATSSGNVLSHFADAGDIQDCWQMPLINTPFWFNALDFPEDEIFHSSSSALEHIIPSSMQELTVSMQKYFDNKLRAPSPPPTQASKTWYSEPLNLDHHNKDVVRVFLDIFRKHIPKTFSLFTKITASRKGQSALTLAMAAVGGLFCSVLGSAEVANSMYNDARKLLLASFNLKTSDDDFSATLEDKLIVVKTFMLLALYGLCSGDKRSYEFMESFHANLIDAVQEYSHAFQKTEIDGQREDDRIRLLEALYLLDCYRIILTQLPPSLSWHHPESFARSSRPTDKIHDMHRLTMEIIDGSRMTVSSKNSESGLASLACASVFLWPVMYPRRNRYDVDAVVVEGLSLWKRDFADLACDSWLRIYGQAADASHLAVYHMLNIMLHANLTVIQSFAHSAPGSPARDPTKRLAAREIYSWRRSSHFQISRWHAEHLIDNIEGMFTAPVRRPEQTGLRKPANQAASSSTESRQLPFEAPHIPYAVYFATLIVWCSKLTDENSTSNSLLAQAVITKGERILSLHKLHIAQLLARVLRDIR